MNVIPQVKCRRCGESYSSLRNSCPHCGTRRVSQSVRTPAPTPGTVKGTEAYERAETNARWQMLFGLILVVAVILAVIVMVSTSLNGTDAGGKTKNTPVIESAAPTIEPAPTPPPTPTPSVTSVAIRYYSNDYTDKDFTMSLSKAEEIPLNAQVFPQTIENPVIKWESSNTDLVEVVDNHDGTCVCKIVGSGGNCTVTATCFGVTAKVTVYCVG